MFPHRHQSPRDISIRTLFGRNGPIECNQRRTLLGPHGHGLAFGLLCVVLACSGCGWMQTPAFHTPSWHHPGSAAQQQYAAIRHDPYPLNDIGPEVVGGRPRDFDKPPNEVTRARQGLPWGNWRGHSQ